MARSYTTKDSGARALEASGMVRDTQAGKPRFDLMVPEGWPYEEQLLTRIANLYGRGADKYAARNWELGDSQVELDRARASAIRHFFQWFMGEDDEDHAAAVFFNVQAAEFYRWRMRTQSELTCCGELATDGR